MNPMSPNSNFSSTIDQKAHVHAFQGRGQVVRDGFFLPVEVGMELQPGDRISAYEDSRAEITFTGVNTKLVLANGSSATLMVQITDPTQGPQWVAGNLYGTKVFFEEGASPVQLAATEVPSIPETQTTPEPEVKPQVDLESPGSSSMMGLFGYDKGQAGQGSFPVMETVAGVAGVALLAGGVSTDDDDSTLTTASQAGFTDSPASGNTSSSGGSAPSSTDSGSNSGSGSTASGGDTSGTSGGTDGATPMESPLDMLLAATPLGEALAPITSAASASGLGELGLLPT